MTLKPCLEEEWFVEDSTRDLAGFCPMCRRDAEELIQLFGKTEELALREIYRQSRAIRVTHMRRDVGPWESARVLQSIRAMTCMAGKIYSELNGGAS